VSGPAETDGEWAGFLDRLIHDLREPLRSVHAYSELLDEAAKGQSGHDNEKAVREILSGTSRIRTLIDGLTGYSRALREVDGEVPAKGTSLQLAFELAVDALGKEIAASEASVSSQGLPRVGVGLEPLTRVLEDLIGNALKFRGTAPPVISVAAVAEDEGWCVCVLDNGIGIDTQDCEKVFQPFVRLHGRKYAGSGLGLTACRKIVEAHGGWIRITPGAEGGAVCSFWLPAVESSQVAHT
jgi:light-regulated signal transduction histidine kinase (bacteriophytochrome)